MKTIAACAHYVLIMSLFVAQISMAWAQNMQLVGNTRLKVLGFEIYDAKLFAGKDFAPQNYLSHDFNLELTYLRNFKGEDIAERSLKEMRKIKPVNDEQGAKWLAAMRCFPDVKKADVITGQYKKNSAAVFTHNGKNVCEWMDAQLSERFFGIWLDPASSAPKMRLQLLGLEKP